MFLETEGGIWRRRTLWIVWTLLTAISASICCGGCLLPFWLHGRIDLQNPLTPTSSSNPQKFIIQPDGSLWLNHHQVVSYLGLFRRCGYLSYTRNEVAWRSGCGYYPSLAAMPHWSWRLGLMLLALAACLLVFLTFFIFFAGFTSPLTFFVHNQKLCHACAITHMIGGILCLTSCILFPIGWGGNDEILQVCGIDSGAFLIGNCEIGWAYVLTVSGGVVSLVLSAMPHLFTITNAPSLQSATSSSSHGLGIGGLKIRYPQSRDRWSMGQYPLLSVPMDTSAYYFPHNLQSSPEHQCDAKDGTHRSLQTRSLIPRPQSAEMNPESVYNMEMGNSGQHRHSVTSNCMFPCIPEQQCPTIIPQAYESTRHHHNSNRTDFAYIEEDSVETEDAILKRHDDRKDQEKSPNQNGHFGEWFRKTSA